MASPKSTSAQNDDWTATSIDDLSAEFDKEYNLLEKDSSLQLNKDVFQDGMDQQENNTNGEWSAVSDLSLSAICLTEEKQAGEVSEDTAGSHQSDGEIDDLASLFGEYEEANFQELLEGSGDEILGAERQSVVDIGSPSNSREKGKGNRREDIKVWEKGPAKAPTALAEKSSQTLGPVSVEELETELRVANDGQVSSSLPPAKSNGLGIADWIRNSNLTIPQIPLPQPPCQSLQQPIQRAQRPSSQPAKQKLQQQPPPQAAFGPSQPISLASAPKPGPKTLTAPTLTPDMEQRCRQRLDLGLRHIREYLQGQKDNTWPVPQHGRSIRQLEAILRVLSSEEWRAYLETKAWEEEQRILGNDYAELVCPANLCRGIADRVDAAMPAFIRHQIRVENAKAKTAKAPAASVPSHIQGAAAQYALPPAISHGNFGMVVGPGYPARFSSPPSGAPSSFQQPHMSKPAQLPPVGGFAALPGSQNPAVNMQPPLQQPQQTGVLLSYPDNIPGQPPSQRALATMHAWESEYFAEFERVRGRATDATGLSRLEQEKSNFRLCFRAQIALMGEGDYMNRLLELTGREDLYGNYGTTVQQNTTSKRGLEDEENEQLSQPTKKSRQF